MAERDDFEDIADGDQLNEGYFNGIKPFVDDVFANRPIMKLDTLYTGTGFDVSENDDGSNSASHTIAISAETEDYDYIIIDLGIWGFIENSSNSAGGYYGVIITSPSATIHDSYDSTNDHYLKYVDSGTNEQKKRQRHQIRVIYAPTSGEKTSGFNLTIVGWVHSNTDGYGTYVGINNEQTVIYKYRNGSIVDTGSY